MMAPSTTENNFRSNLAQFRWARGVTDDSQVPDAGTSRNPFSRFYNALGGAYIPLRSNENSNEDEAYFALSRWERFASLLARVRVGPLTTHLFVLFPVDCSVFSPASRAQQFALESLF
jgi:hypothetical protein